MNKEIPNGLRITFIVHALVALVFGAALLTIPGRALSTLAWVPENVPLPDSELAIPGQTFVDPALTRLLGAALLALAYLSFRCWRRKGATWQEVGWVVEFEAALCGLSALALLLGFWRMERAVPLVGWLILLLYLAFFGVWSLFLVRGRRG